MARFRRLVLASTVIVKGVDVGTAEDDEDRVLTVADEDVGEVGKELGKVEVVQGQIVLVE